jgi:predicted nuclease of predicted toxin-antitoxin system
VNFLIDAQLPRRMKQWFAAAACDAIHTLDLPDRNRTPDEALNDLAAQEGRIVVTKDADFVDSHLLARRPAKLLLVSTGNISNEDLEKLIKPLLPQVLLEFRTNSFIELGRAGIIVRG